VLVIIIGIGIEVATSRRWIPNRRSRSAPAAVRLDPGAGAVASASRRTAVHLKFNMAVETSSPGNT
jgi:hypothetical protein